MRLISFDYECRVIEAGHSLFLNISLLTSCTSKSVDSEGAQWRSRAAVLTNCAEGISAQFVASAK
jgi:hypothetical protein